MVCGAGLFINPYSAGLRHNARAMPSEPRDTTHGAQDGSVKSDSVEQCWLTCDGVRGPLRVVYRILDLFSHSWNEWQFLEAISEQMACEEIARRHTFFQMIE